MPDNPVAAARDLLIGKLSDEMDPENAREMVDDLIAAVRAEPTCATCQHWLPWQRPDAAKPLVSTKGDCTHTLLRGHLNGMDETFSCRFHSLR